MKNHRKKRTLAEMLGLRAGSSADAIEQAVVACQDATDAAAARLIEAARQPMTQATQVQLLSELLGYQVATMALVSIAYKLATGPAVDDKA